jgi:hypothetical protein
MLPKEHQTLKMHILIICVLNCFSDNFKSNHYKNQVDGNYNKNFYIILLSILNDHNYLEFKIMKGVNIKQHPHFWLESESYIIDFKNDIFSFLVHRNDFMLNFDYFLNNEQLHLDVISDEAKDLLVKFKHCFYEHYF